MLSFPVRPVKTPTSSCKKPALRNCRFVFRKVELIPNYRIGQPTKLMYRALARMQSKPFSSITVTGQADEISKVAMLMTPQRMAVSDNQLQPVGHYLRDARTSLSQFLRSAAVDNSDASVERMTHHFKSFEESFNAGVHAHAMATGKRLSDSEKALLYDLMLDQSLEDLKTQDKYKLSSVLRDNHSDIHAAFNILANKTPTHISSKQTTAKPRAAGAVDGIIASLKRHGVTKSFMQDRGVWLPKGEADMRKQSAGRQKLFNRPTRDLHYLEPAKSSAKKPANEQATTVGNYVHSLFSTPKESLSNADQSYLEAANKLTEVMRLSAKEYNVREVGEGLKVFAQDIRRAQQGHRKNIMNRHYHKYFTDEHPNTKQIEGLANVLKGKDSQRKQVMHNALLNHAWSALDATEKSNFLIALAGDKPALSRALRDGHYESDEQKAIRDLTATLQQHPDISLYME